MDKLPFLSEQWLDTVNQMRLAHGSKACDQVRDGSQDEPVRINQTVTGAPFGDGTVLVHVDTSDARFPLGPGHLADADVTLVLDYAVARAILVDGNPRAAMQAFMTGQLRVQGELAKLITAQQRMPYIFGAELAARIRQITV